MEEKVVHAMDKGSFNSLLSELELLAAGYGYAYGIISSQIKLETGNGQKIIDKNLFNIKATGTWLELGKFVEVGTTEYEKGKPVKQPAKFRKYESYEASLMDYVSLIGRLERYKLAWVNRDNPIIYFNSLYTGGYATDPQYATKMIKIYNEAYA